MKRLRESWHTRRYVVARRWRYALRAVLVFVALVTSIATHRYDSPVYGGNRGQSDPVSLVVLIACVALALWITRATI